MNLKAMFTRWVCGWLHGGGIIKRDPAGHINWQCAKCGAWSDPVSFDDEARVVDAALRRDRRIAVYGAEIEQLRNRRIVDFVAEIERLREALRAETVRCAKVCEDYARRCRDAGYDSEAAALRDAGRIIRQ